LRKSFHGSGFFSRASAVWRLNVDGSSRAFTWPHDRGNAMPAPGRARGDQGATAVAMRSLRR